MTTLRYILALALTACSVPPPECFELSGRCVYELVSPHDAEITLPELTASDLDIPTFYVVPAMYANWQAMLTANTSIRRFKLVGDFTSWGVLEPTTTQGGTEGARRIIMHGDASATPPWERATETLVSQFFIGTSAGQPSSHWVLHGLTTRTPACQHSVRMGSFDVIIDRVLLDGCTSYGIRILLFAHDVTVQRSVLRADIDNIVGDVPGVQIRIPNDGTSSGGSTRMENIRLVSNEISDFPDQIAVTHDVDNVPTPGGIGNGIVNGLIIANNDFYTSSEHFNAAGRGPTENALDLKGGSSDPLNPVQVVDNRMRGFRYSTIVGGSDGAAIVIHNWSRNYLVARNYIYDCPIAMRVDSWPAGQPNVPRGVVFEENVVHGIRKFDPTIDRGVAFQANTTITLRRNHFVHFETLLDVNMISGQAAHTYADNTMLDGTLGTAASAWNAGTGNRTLTRRDAVALTFETNLDGTELVSLRNARVLE